MQLIKAATEWRILAIVLPQAYQLLAPQKGNVRQFSHSKQIMAEMGR